MPIVLALIRTSRKCCCYETMKIINSYIVVAWQLKTNNYRNCTRVLHFGFSPTFPHWFLKLWQSLLIWKKIIQDIFSLLKVWYFLQFPWSNFDIFILYNGNTLTKYGSRLIVYVCYVHYTNTILKKEQYIPKLEHKHLVSWQAPITPKVKESWDKTK